MAEQLSSNSNGSTEAYPAQSFDDPLDGRIVVPEGYQNYDVGGAGDPDTFTSDPDGALDVLPSSVKASLLGLHGVDVESATSVEFTVVPKPHQVLTGVPRPHKTSRRSALREDAPKAESAPVMVTYDGFCYAGVQVGYSPKILPSYFRGLVSIGLAQNGDSLFADIISEKLPQNVLELHYPDNLEDLSVVERDERIEVEAHSLAAFAAAIQSNLDKVRTRTARDDYLREVMPRGLGARALSCWAEVAAANLE